MGRRTDGRMGGRADGAWSGVAHASHRCSPPRRGCLMMHARTHTHARTNARTHARTHAHTRTHARTLARSLARTHAREDRRHACVVDGEDEGDARELAQDAPRRPEERSASRRRRRRPQQLGCHFATAKFAAAAVTEQCHCVCAVFLHFATTVSPGVVRIRATSLAPSVATGDGRMLARACACGRQELLQSKVQDCKIAMLQCKRRTGSVTKPKLSPAPPAT